MIDTPICDFVEAYIQKHFSRFHMPGHKGTDERFPLLARDITEIEGADDLYHADGIILKSEENASALFGSRHTFYSTEGSSLCIRAMLYLAVSCAPRVFPSSHTFACPDSRRIPSASSGTPLRPSPSRRRILAARNAHKTFLYTCALLDLDVVWLYPEASSKETQTASICSCPVSAEYLQHTLEHFSGLPEEERPLAVFLTSPDYLGGVQDIAALSAICHRFGLPLLVDNAHGAYLKFLSPSRHPLDLGADMCCDSAHKTLPALTGCAYLHISRAAIYPYEKKARTALSLFGSTSPSYLLLQSLDWCNAYLAGSPQGQINLTPSYPDRLISCIAKKEAVCQMLLGRGFLFRDADPLRIVFYASALGYSGHMLAEYLRLQHIECEYADQDYVVLMVTPENSEEDWNRLESLKPPKYSDVSLSCPKPDLFPAATSTCSLPAALSIREALFAPSEAVPVSQALGRICAAPTVSCPPAIPIVVSGERITKECLALCRYYSITDLQVVAEEA